MLGIRSQYVVANTSRGSACMGVLLLSLSGLSENLTGETCFAISDGLYPLCLSLEESRSKLSWKFCSLNLSLCVGTC